MAMVLTDEKQSGRRRWISSVAILVSGAAVGALALWASGFPPKNWLSPKHPERPPVRITRGISAPTPASGEPVDVAKAFPGIASSVSKEPRSLVLTGTILGRNAYDGVAFIGIDERNPQTYVAGAILANGARLTQIAKDYVVLEKDGASVRLYAQSVKSRAQMNSRLLTVGGPQKFVPAVSTNTEIFTQFIRPNPVYDGQMLTGYEVYAGPNASIFSRLGFQSGDIITAFDNVPVSDPQTAIELLQQLATGITMTATVRRKGKIERLSLDGSIVSSELDRTRHARGRAATESAGPPT